MGRTSHGARARFHERRNDSPHLVQAGSGPGHRVSDGRGFLVTGGVS
jgi:hypothetical protein